MKTTYLLHIQNLHHSYEKKTALRGISFSVAEGEIFGLLGPNGGGKSTTFKILSTFLFPTSGTVSMFGFDILKQPEEIRNRIGVVFQSPSLDGKLTVEENLRHQGHLYNLHGKKLQERINYLLERFGLTERRNDFTEKLSGGLQRRVEIAKSLLHKPLLLLLDEPSTGLDPGARITLWELLKELREKENVTILLTTHLLEEAEKCDRLVILDEGTLVADGSPAELKHEIGGDVLSIGTANAEELCKKLREHFGENDCGTILDSNIRIERKNGHEFIPQLISAFPDDITSVTLQKPTLEDVFIHKTGKHFGVQQ
ncbi:MAG: ATP-binding cassette domain-containing protein [Bacteroidota bacterium]